MQTFLIRLIILKLVHSITRDAGTKDRYTPSSPYMRVGIKTLPKINSVSLRKFIGPCFQLNKHQSENFLVRAVVCESVCLCLFYVQSEIAEMAGIQLAHIPFFIKYCCSTNVVCLCVLVCMCSCSCSIPLNYYKTVQLLSPFLSLKLRSSFYSINL